MLVPAAKKQDLPCAETYTNLGLLVGAVVYFFDCKLDRDSTKVFVAAALGKYEKA